MENNKVTPKDWLEGLKENWSSDLNSGFTVALLALPLSLGIAAASDFPNPLYGVLTAIIGGLIVSLFMGARLTIKGPAAGLIVIVAGAVAEFGGGETGWHLALGAMVVAAVIQILFGLMKFGRFSDFFPVSAIHGMLAAIGIIIMSKQLHILMGVNPVFLEGRKAKPIVEPMALIEYLPNTISKMISDPVFQSSLIVGIVCLIIVFAYPMIKSPLIKKIPMPIIVLLVAIPLGHFLGLTQDNKELVKVGSFTAILGFHVSFEGISMMSVFIKYVVLFALIGSLESLLTAKAIDMLDPFKRKSDFNQDLIAVGGGNALAACLGGLPMIAEVARSSANVANGGKTRWANFFHGLILLIFVLFLTPVIEMIPKSALAALLIGVGFKLAHPKEFKHALHIGKEQFIVFVATVIVTLLTDLLIGVGVGILLEMILSIAMYKASLGKMTKLDHQISQDGETATIKLNGNLSFMNVIALKGALAKIPAAKQLNIDLSGLEFADHTSVENIHHFEHDYRHTHHANVDTILPANLQRPTEHPAAAIYK